jgi:hypothetical protein
MMQGAELQAFAAKRRNDSVVLAYVNLSDVREFFGLKTSPFRQTRDLGFEKLTQRATANKVGNANV